MGSCACITKPNLLSMQGEFLCNYPTKATVNLKSFDSGQNIQIPTEIHLTKPLSTKIELVSLNLQNFWVSFSVLPGQDPQGNYFQKCMDSCFYLHNEHSLLLCLFDGHGPEGENVINFCCSFVNRFFRNKSELLRVNFT